MARRPPHTTRHAANDRRVAGQSLVELALVVPMLIFLIGGTFELGRLIYSSASVSHAAREGARSAMDATVSDAEVTARVVESARPLTVAGGDVQISPRSPGGSVTVDVTYRFSSPIPLIDRLWGGGTLEITRTRVARVQELE